MKIIVLDTDILIDNIYGFAPWVKLFLQLEDVRLVVPTIVIAEYLNDKKAETELGEKESKKYLSWFQTQDLNEEIAYILGMILRRKMYTSGASLADLIIASTAIYLNAKLATNNKKDFAKIPGLRLFDPEKLRN
ncbi:PIN domain-containing protein [Patescibacteria group bacterium]|nr:PIN domain-containing protein [Patescibacteria group bacterium]MCL5010488.1 PIN domain-containing protein [Patescibacteria group bacterium]